LDSSSLGDGYGLESSLEFDDENHLDSCRTIEPEARSLMATSVT